MQAHTQVLHNVQCTYPWQSTRDELQHGHLSRGVLHGHTVGAEEEVRLSSDNVLVLGVVKVTVGYLLRQGQRLLQPACMHT